MSKDKRDVKVAGIQMHCKIGDKEANIQRASELIDEAAKDGAKIVLLQELFNTEYICFCRRNPKAFEYAEPIPGPTTNKIAEKARKHRIYIIAPTFEKAAPGMYYNTSSLIGPSGDIIGTYRKTHIAAINSIEKLYFRPGSEFPVFKTDYGNLGVMICYDRQFPESFRIVTLKGAEIVFVSSATEEGWAREISWDLLLRVRAYENGVFVVAVNRVGREEDQVYFGGGLVISPRGEVLARGKDGEDDIVSAVIDLNEVDKARIEIPLLRDVRPELYVRHIKSIMRERGI